MSRHDHNNRRSQSRAALAFACVFGLLSAASSAVSAAAEEAPDYAVRRATETLLEEVRAREPEVTGNPHLVRRIVEEVVWPLVDMDTIAKRVLDSHWAQASMQQRERFREELEERLLRAYANLVAEHPGARIRSADSEHSSDGLKATVHTVITGAGIRSLDVEYRLRRSDDGWRVIDVVVDGLGIVALHRRLFWFQIARLGLEDFLVALEDTNDRARAAEATAVSLSD